MAEVYKITTADGQEFAWHGGAAALRKAHPGASITARLVPDDIRGGTWESVSDRQALAAEKKAAGAEGDAVAEDEPQPTTTTKAPKAEKAAKAPELVVEVVDEPVKEDAK